MPSHMPSQTLLFSAPQETDQRSWNPPDVSGGFQGGFHESGFHDSVFPVDMSFADTELPGDVALLQSVINQQKILEKQQEVLKQQQILLQRRVAREGTSPGGRGGFRSGSRSGSQNGSGHGNSWEKSPYADLGIADIRTTPEPNIGRCQSEGLSQTELPVGPDPWDTCQAGPGIGFSTMSPTFEELAPFDTSGEADMWMSTLPSPTPDSVSLSLPPDHTCDSSSEPYVQSPAPLAPPPHSSSSFWQMLTSGSTSSADQATLDQMDAFGQGVDSFFGMDFLNTPQPQPQPRPHFEPQPQPQLQYVVPDARTGVSMGGHVPLHQFSDPLRSPFSTTTPLSLPLSPPTSQQRQLSPSPTSQHHPPPASFPFRVLDTSRCPPKCVCPDCQVVEQFIASCTPSTTSAPALPWDGGSQEIPTEETSSGPLTVYSPGAVVSPGVGENLGVDPTAGWHYPAGLRVWADTTTGGTPSLVPGAGLSLEERLAACLNRKLPPAPPTVNRKRRVGLGEMVQVGGAGAGAGMGVWGRGGVVEMRAKVARNLGSLGRVDKPFREAVLRAVGVLPIPHPVDANTEGTGGGQGSGAVSEAMLRGALFVLAEAVATGDEPRYKSVSDLLDLEANPDGSVMQRLVFYFMAALKARMENTAFGPEAGAYNPPKTHIELSAFVAFVQSLEELHFWMNSISVAVSSVITPATTCLHIIDFGMWSGQWGSIFRKLHFMGPTAPHLRLTFIEPPPGTPKGLGPSMRMEDLTHEMAELEAKYGVGAEVRVVQGRVEELRAEALGVVRGGGGGGGGETVVVNFACRLAQLMDAQVVRWSPRDAVLRTVRGLDPDLVTIAEVNLNTNGPFFLTRFKDLLEGMTLMYSCHDGAMERACNFRGVSATEGEEMICAMASRLTLEHVDYNTAQVRRLRAIMGRRMVESLVGHELILNVVACEGANRVARHETMDKLQERMWKAGFVNKPYQPAMVGMIEKAGGKDRQLRVRETVGAVGAYYMDRSIAYASMWITARQSQLQVNG